LLEGARHLNGLAVPDIQPWRLKVRFQRYEKTGKSIDQGSFELLWVSARKNKSVYTSPSFSQVEYSSPEGPLRTGNREDPPGLLLLIWWIAYSPLPTERTVARLGADLRRETADGIDLNCIALGKGPAITRYDRATDTLIDPASDASTPPDSYCFDVHQFLVRSSRTINGFREKIHASFRNPIRYEGHVIAQDLDLDLGGVVMLTAHVESIEPLRNSDGAEFQIPAGAQEPKYGVQ
jgi:hypothetical protein